MATITKVFSNGIQCKSDAKTRLWLKPGESVLIDHTTILTTYFDRYDETYTPLIVARSPAAEVCVVIPQESYEKFLLSVGLYILPVAMECDNAGHPLRLMIDIGAKVSVDYYDLETA